MQSRRRKTPQQKKALSRAKDRREHYGQNDKAARKLIPIRKAQSHRKIRRVGKLALFENPETADAVFKSLRTDRWRKWPGNPLGRDIDSKLNARAFLQRTGHLGPQGRARLQIERMRQWKVMGVRGLDPDEIL